MGQRPKNCGAIPKQILDFKLHELFPLTLDEFGNEASAIGKFIFLSFRAYKERLDQSPYATWAAVLVRTAPGLRICVDADLN